MIYYSTRLNRNCLSCSPICYICRVKLWLLTSNEDEPHGLFCNEHTKPWEMTWIQGNALTIKYWCLYIIWNGKSTCPQNLPWNFPV